MWGGWEKNFSHCLRGEKLLRESERVRESDREKEKKIRLRMLLRFYVTLKRTTSTFDKPLVFLNAVTWGWGRVFSVTTVHYYERERRGEQIVTSVGVILDISPK